MTDHDWVAIRAGVQCGLLDFDPDDEVFTDPRDRDAAIDTVTDHLASMLARGTLVKRERGFRLRRRRRARSSTP